MNDFKECYQSAVNDMLGEKEFHIDASQCMDVKRHNRFMARRLKRTAASAFSAACVIFLCGFGTVKAAEYIENVIKVNQWGFESADAVTMARNEAEDTQAHIVSEELGINPEAADAGSEILGAQGAAEGDGQRTEDMQERSFQQKDEGMAMAEADTLDGAEEDMDNRIQQTEEGEQASQKEAVEELKIEDIPVKNYNSLEEFEENEDIIFPQPSIILSGGAETVDITICGDWAMARYDMDGKVIWVERTDYANTQGHASSKVFPGGVCNERAYTTAQGYTYTLVDSVRENDEEALQIHGAVTVGTYEAYIDFMGYTEAEAKKMIESIDLSEYE